MIRVVELSETRRKLASKVIKAFVTYLLRVTKIDEMWHTGVEKILSMALKIPMRILSSAATLFITT